MPQRTASIKIDVESAEARLAIESLEEGLQDVNVAARGADQSIDGVANPAQAARIKATGEAAESAADDFDDLDRSADSSRISMRDLTQELRLFTKAVGSIPGPVKAAIGALAGGGVAVGAGLGLAGAATAAGAQLGPQGLQRDIQEVGALAKQTGRIFAEEFADVIRGNVLPAGRRLLLTVQGISDELATFSDASFEALEQMGKLLAQGGPLQAVGTLIGGVAADEPDAPGGDPSGGRMARVQQQIRKLRTEQQKAAGGASRLGTFLLPEEQVLNRRLSAFKNTRQELAKFTTTLEQGTPARDRALREIGRLTRRMQDLKGELFAAQAQDAIRPQRRIRGAAPSAAPPGGGLDRQLQQSIAQGSREMTRNFQEAGEKVEQGVNRQLAQGIQLASQLGSTLVQSAQRGSLTFQKAFSSILGVVGSVIGVANPAAGAAISGAGRLVGSFESGGVVDTPLQIVGESGPELAAMPQGTRVSSNRDTMAMMERMAQAVEGREVAVPVRNMRDEIVQADLADGERSGNVVVANVEQL
jgi:hypothetical protein